jgi:hypothetical protein
MIVRDTEEKGKDVARCIRSAAQICARAVVIDTGSVDNTEEVVKAACVEAGLQLNLGHSEWVGHTHNRSELLALCRAFEDIDWVLMLDADMELVLEQPLPLEAMAEYDECMIPIYDRGLFYPLPLLTSNRREFAYHGPTHSHLIATDVPEKGDIRGLRLNGVAKLIDHGGGGQAGKIENDVKVLREAVAENPADARSWFYLAQSYRDLDMVNEAIHAYKVRAMLGGWPEEVYNALYQAGALLCRHVNFYQGAKLLVSAAEMKPNRAEALRFLAGSAESVANKIPFPHDEVLFLETSAYTYKPPAEEPLAPLPPKPKIRPRTKKLYRQTITLDDITAIIVTRGNVDLAPILETLPYPDVVVWDNSLREYDYKIFGRYAAIPEALNPVIYYQDDDVIFTEHDALLAEWNGGVVANMDQAWLEGAGYLDTPLLMLGAGSLVPAGLPAKVFAHYFRSHPWDDDLLVEADFAFGCIAPGKRVQLPYTAREFSDAPDRLYQQEGQTSRKWDMIARATLLRQTYGA